MKKETESGDETLPFSSSTTEANDTAGDLAEDRDATTPATTPAAASTITSTTIQEEAVIIGSVTVMDVRTHDTMKFGYTATTTLAQLKLDIRRDLFQQQLQQTSTMSDGTSNDARRCNSPSMHVDGILQLFWLGKELKEGCSWHTVGVIEEEDVVLMKDLDFGTKFGGMAATTTTSASSTAAAARAESQQRPIIYAHFQPPPSSFSLQQGGDESDNYY